jgi:hypothetical protein
MVTAPGALSALTPQTLALQAVQERLKRGPSPTQDQKDALARLEQVHQAFKAGSRGPVAETAKSRFAESMRANAASATEYLQNARAATGEIRGLLKELDATLRKAGLSPDEAGSSQAGDAAAAEIAPAASPWGDGAKSKALALSEIRATATDIAQTVGKVVKKLRQDLLAAQLRGADPQQVRDVQKQLRDGEQELSAAMRGLNGGASSPGTGGSRIDLRA